MGVVLSAAAAFAAAQTDRLSVQVVKEESGKVVADLQLDDFVVRVDGEPVRVASGKRVRRALDLTVVVEKRRWSPIDRLVEDLLGVLASNLEEADRVGLLVAGRTVETVVAPGSERNEFALALARARSNPGRYVPRSAPAPGPALYDAVVAASQHDFEGEERRRAVLLVSSDEDDSLVAGVDDAIDAAQEAKLIVSLHTAAPEPLRLRGGRVGADPTPAPDARGRPPEVGWPNTLPPMPRPVPTRTGRSLEKVVRKTGGEVSKRWTGGHSLRVIADHLRERYELTLAVPIDPWAEVEVEVDKKKAVALVQKL